MRCVVVLVALAACFEQPEIAEGLFCSATGACPPGQSCAQDGRCYVQPVNTVDAARPDAPIVIPDAPPAGTCTLAPQAGCPDGDKCTSTQIDPPTTICIGNGTVGLKGACGGPGTSDNCASGLICIFNVCHALCATPTTQGGCFASELCMPFANFDACLTTCDALAQNCPTIASGPQACFESNVGGTCSPSAKNLAAGAACMFLNDCAKGSGCICNDASCSASTCRRYCDFAATPNQQGTCATGETCQMFVSNVGVCK